MAANQTAHRITREVSRALAKALKRSPLTRGEVAGRAGISEAALSQIITRKVQSSRYLEKLFAVLGIPKHLLYRLDDIEREWLDELHRLRTDAGEDAAAYFTQRLAELVDREIEIAEARAE